MPDLVIVSGEPLWPPVHGGRLRGARVTEALAKRLRVCVIAPVEQRPPPGLDVEALPERSPLGRFEGFGSMAPRLGAVALGRERATAVERLVRRLSPDALLFLTGPTAAAAPDLGLPFAVDFHDLEVRRQASMARRGPPRHRTLAVWEAAKAHWWEPRLARRAAVVAAPTLGDVELLRTWARLAVHVPNGADPISPVPSPPTGPVTFVASFSYPPNADAARWLLAEVWPRLRAEAPEIRLRFAGREAFSVLGDGPARQGVEVIADPVTADHVYEEASVVLAPVRTGGGAQLKVTEALARGRVVVATRYSAAAAPVTARDAVTVADTAEATVAAILDRWRDVQARWVAERSLVASPPIPDWDEACRPLTDALAGLVATR